MRTGTIEVQEENPPKSLSLSTGRYKGYKGKLDTTPADSSSPLLVRSEICTLEKMLVVVELKVYGG